MCIRDSYITNQKRSLAFYSVKRYDTSSGCTSICKIKVDLGQTRMEAINGHCAASQVNKTEEAMECSWHRQGRGRRWDKLDDGGGGAAAAGYLYTERV